jgi:hypothetical protein
MVSTALQCKVSKSAGMGDVLPRCVAGFVVMRSSQLAGRSAISSRVGTPCIGVVSAVCHSYISPDVWMLGGAQMYRCVALYRVNSGA